MKKFLLMMIAAVLVLGLLGCSAEKPASNGSQTGSAPIDSISTEQIATLFMDMTELGLANSCFMYEVTPDDAAYLIGYEGFSGSFESAHAIAPNISTSPFVLAAFRLEEGANVAAFAADIKANANPAKWICVQADVVEALVDGHTVVFYMCPEEFAQPLSTCFEEIGKKGFDPAQHIINPLDGLSMDELYGKLYETFSVENYGFMDNSNKLTLENCPKEDSFGLEKLTDSQYVDSLIDSGYSPASEEDGEKTYMLAMFRLSSADDAAALAFIDEIKASIDLYALKGGEAECMVAYGSGVVIVYAATGSYGISSAPLSSVLATEYRMTAGEF